MNSIDLRIKCPRATINFFIGILAITLLAAYGIWIWIFREDNVALQILLLIFSTVFGIPAVWMVVRFFIKGKFIKDHKIVLTENAFSCEGADFTGTPFQICWEDFGEIQFWEATKIQIIKINEVDSQHLINFNLIPKQKRYLIEHNSGRLFDKALVVALVEKFRDTKTRRERGKLISKFTSKKIKIPQKNRGSEWCSNCEILCQTDTSLPRSKRVCTNCYFAELQEVDWGKSYWENLNSERRARL